MLGDLGESDALKYQDDLDFTRDEKSLDRFRELLKNHVEFTLYPGTDVLRANSDKAFQLISDFLGGGRSVEDDVDDYVSPLDIDQYIKFRAETITHYYQSRAPKLGGWTNISEVVGFVLTSGGSILAVVDQPEWIAFTVGIASLNQNVIDYFGFSDEMKTMNQALRGLQNLRVWWESLSLVNRRTRESREKAVGSVEGAYMSWATTRAGTAVSLSSSSADTSGSGTANGESKQEGDSAA